MNSHQLDSSQGTRPSQVGPSQFYRDLEGEPLPTQLPGAPGSGYMHADIRECPLPAPMGGELGAAQRARPEPLSTRRAHRAVLPWLEGPWLRVQPHNQGKLREPNLRAREPRDLHKGTASSCLRGRGCEMSSESSPVNESVPCKAFASLGPGPSPAGSGMSPATPGERPQARSRV